MKVLVVDDYRPNRLLPVAMLKKLGIEAVAVESGEEALNWLAQDPLVDQVLLDISMPGMSGTEVCRRLRQDPVLKHLRVVAYTAHAFSGEKSDILAGGFDDLLIKPIDRQSLMQVLGLDGAWGS